MSLRRLAAWQRLHGAATDRITTAACAGFIALAFAAAGWQLVFWSPP